MKKVKCAGSSTPNQDGSAQFGEHATCHVCGCWVKVRSGVLKPHKDTRTQMS